MGGGVAAFEESNQYRKFCEQLDTVTFYIHFSNGGNLELFDLDKLHRSLAGKVSSKLDESGIRYKETFVDGGGGGLETLWEIVQRLLETKELIAFLYSIFSYAKTAYQHYINNTVDDLRPAIDIHLYMEADKNISKIKKSDVNLIVSRRLANLLIVANEILNTLNKDLNGFNFNVSVAAEIFSQHSSVNFSLPKKSNTLNSVNRMLQIIKDLKLRENHFSRYSFHPLGIIKREDTKLIKVDDSLEAKGAGTYFLVVSTCIIADYFI